MDEEKAENGGCTQDMPQKTPFYMRSKLMGGLFAAAVCLLAALICITIVSKCSPLYAFHDGNDVNWFLTMGRGMAQGKVPYKDLFEQKGVLLYMLFALNYLICGNSLYFIWIVEVVCLALFCFIAFRTARLFTGYVPSLAVALICAPLASSSYAFASGGGEVEEYFLPMLTYAVYLAVRMLRGERLPLCCAAICGMFSGIIFWIKYTSLVMFAVLAVCIFVECCLNGKARLGFAYAGIFIAAFVAVSVPPLVYFVVNGAVGDMWRVYFLDNIFGYGVRWIPRLGSMLLNVLLCSPLYAAAAFALLFVWKRDCAVRHKVYFTAMVALTFLVQCVTAGGIVYYHLVMAAFLPLGLLGARTGIAAAAAAVCAPFRGNSGEASVRSRYALRRERFCAGIGRAVKSAAVCTRAGINAATAVLCAALLASVSLVFGNNTLELFLPRESYPQFRAAEIMKEAGGGSLLTYKTYGRGFYTARDEVPQFYYFAKNNFDRQSFPEMYEAQEGYVARKEAEFVITTAVCWDEERDTLLSGYEFIADLSYRHIECNIDIENVRLCLLARQG